MPIDLKDQSTLSGVLKEIKQNQENLDRKSRSKYEFDVYSERQKPYVKEFLKQEFGVEAASEMPMIHSVPLCKRIVDQEASIYKMEPVRSFNNVSEEQESKIQDAYDKFKADTILARSNAFFKLQSQNHLQLIVKNGRFVFRTLLNHYLDAIPEDGDPTVASAIIMSAFDSGSMNFGHVGVDKLRGTTGGVLRSDGLNQKIGDPDDYQAELDRFVIWQKDANFIANGKGEIVSRLESGEFDMATPIPGFLPFIDVSLNKDFTYWSHAYNSTPDFSIQFNGSLSDMAHIVRSQGWAQPVFVGPEYSIPKIQRVGPTYAIHLITDPEKPAERPSFDFKSANPDIAGSFAFQDMLLANFLSAKGIDPKTISGKAEGTKYNSGVERLLAQIDQFSASRADFAVYREVENQLFEIFKAWQNLAGDLIDDRWRTGTLSPDAYVDIDFGKPELIRTEREKAEDVVYRVDNALMTRLEAIKELYGVDDESAGKILKDIETERMARSAIVIETINDRSEIEGEQDETEI